jgi:hypothetical protein
MILAARLTTSLTALATTTSFVRIQQQQQKVNCITNRKADRNTNSNAKSKESTTGNSMATVSKTTGTKNHQEISTSLDGIPSAYL